MYPVYGYVEDLAVEQIGNRDSVRVWLHGHPRMYFTYLDEGATVALAQLQLLRDAVERGLEVRLMLRQLPLEIVVVDSNGDTLSPQYPAERFLEVKLYGPNTPFQLGTLPAGAPLGLLP